MNTMCVPINGQSKTLPVESDMTDVQSLMRPEDDVLREHLIMDSCKQETMQEPTFMTRARSCRNCMIAAEKDTQNELLICCMLKSLN